MAKRSRRAKKSTAAARTVKKSGNEGTLKLIAVLLLILSVAVIIALTMRITG